MAKKETGHQACKVVRIFREVGLRQPGGLTQVRPHMTEPSPRITPIFWVLLVTVVIMGLLPWWRNHSYLRDLYDYGLVITANGHMERGERPYVDFTTPIRAGFLGLNWLIERAGGGTYAALTRGGAGLILASGLLLPLMLVQRWPWWAAIVVGGAVTAAAAAQHTILWHNSLGVFCLAVAVWASAIAPVVRREHRFWHLLAAVGLFLGGINKLNFHLVAVAASLAWALRAGLVGRAGWGRVACTLLGVLACGVVLPLAAELLWTEASLKLWLTNVTGIATESRLDQLKLVWSWDFLFRPIHDYYGPQALPQVGLIGLLVSLVTLVGCWPRGDDRAARWDRGLLPLAVILAGAAGAALLATNFEIACLGGAAWAVLLAGLWLGFAPAGRRTLFAAGFVLPALLIGGAGWWSAWLGQRSQFGFSYASREDYQPAENASPAYGSLRGLRLPPEMILSLEALGDILAEDRPGGRPVFYGPGMELLDRYFPSKRRKGQPLWAHWGTSYDARAVTRLRDTLQSDASQRTVFTNVAFAHWPTEIQDVLDENFVRDLVGPIAVRWQHNADAVANLSDSFDTLNRLGGNVDGRAFHLDRFPLRVWRTAEGQAILGTNRPAGQVLLRTPVYRLGGTAVIARLPDSGDGPLAADVKVIVHGASPEDVRWSARLELPAGQQTLSFPFQADAGGRMLMFWVTLPPGQPAGAVAAGFRDLQITHAVEVGTAPRLRADSPADVASVPGHAESLFGNVAWRPAQLVVRNGGPMADGLQLSPGGEVWLHTDGMNGELRGQVSCPPGDGRPPVVRVVWYKGGRLQIIHQEWAKREQPFDFKVWTAEPGGWFGVLVDSGKDLAPVRVRVTGTTLQP